MTATRPSSRNRVFISATNIHLAQFDFALLMQRLARGQGQAQALQSVVQVDCGLVALLQAVKEMTSLRQEHVVAHKAEEVVALAHFTLGIVDVKVVGKQINFGDSRIADDLESPHRRALQKVLMEQDREAA